MKDIDGKIILIIALVVLLGFTFLNFDVIKLNVTSRLTDSS
jgi:hypothetical protein